ncbi:hypothetical protein [Verrucomicrobium spinosum]|uniref:hypothetical protein n=1 Tax=Verrucomicrobium spinosum TaxID=2736 RepID=UPI000AD152FE|nr:hypothetical protein [Verrucomicrobium spinosum]
MLITRVLTDDAAGLAYVVDDRSNVHALDIRTGKLRCVSARTVAARSSLLSHRPADGP